MPTGAASFGNQARSTSSGTSNYSTGWPTARKQDPECYVLGLAVTEMATRRPVTGVSREAQAHGFPLQLHDPLLILGRHAGPLRGIDLRLYLQLTRHTE
jgi:hypothetical protein